MRDIKLVFSRTDDDDDREEYEKVIVRDTDEALQEKADAELYHDVGFAWYRKRDYDKALFYFNKMMELQPDADAYFWRAETLIQMNEYEKALEDLTTGIANKNSLANPENLSTLYCRRGLCYHRLDRNKEALKEQDKAVKLEPEESAFYYWRATVLMAMNKTDKALADLDIVIKHNPEDTDAYLDRSLCWDAKGENKKAMDDLNKIISLDPAYGAAYNNRAVIWSNLGELQRALRDCGKAIDTDPNHAQFYFCRGNVHEKLKDFKSAIADFDKALELDPKHKAALEGRQDLKRRMLARSFQ